MSSGSSMYDNYPDEDLYHRSNASVDRPNSTQPTTNHTLDVNDVNDKVRPTSSLERKTTLGVPVTDFSKSRIKENDYMKTTTADFTTHPPLNGLSSDRIDEMSSKVFAQRGEVKVKSESENSIGKHGKRKYVDASPKRENRKKKKAAELEVSKRVSLSIYLIVMNISESNTNQS